ncbi:CG7968 [Drosophila busckii]|uniref:CG7968 n=1 Tax=Drosophila busckii TaxID=30019 RepID=A0A0M5J994_DROBS|nr:CG7968 [Drosophila busckii]
MRATLFIILALLGCSCSSATLFDDQLRELTEFLRLQMRCGYPPLGIPVLAPAQLAYKKLNIKTESLACQGNFTDLSIVGLDSFEFRQLNWNNVLHKIRFDLNFPSIKLTSSKYQLDILSRLFGSDFSLWGDGVFDLELLNLRANGSFIIRPSGLTHGTHIKSWKVDWQLGAANSKITGIMGSRLWSKFVNDIINEFFELTINDNPEEVADFMQQLIVPPMNAALENVAWYEITAVILGLVKGVLPVEPIC